jgi:hypothetical protein
MNRRRWVWGIGVALALGLGGCIGGASRPLIQVPDTARVVEDHILWAPTTWSGTVRLVRPLIVTRTASLTLQPGTRVFFDLPEPQEGKDREPWILIQGTLVALGSAEQPIVFSSAALRHSELDDMIHVQEAKEAHLRYCVFERGPWALHINDTPVEVVDSIFRNNYGGVRCQGGRVVLRGSRFEDNRIGVRCLKGSPVIEQNVFTDNLTGIFFRQEVVDPVVRNNNFDNREYDLKLGEAQTRDVDAARNWWATSAKGQPEDRIFDGGDSAGIGFVATDPVLAQPWQAEPKP